MLRLDGQTPDRWGSKQGLIGLNSQDHSASGVAIQILHAASGVPVDIGSSWKIGSYPLARRTIEVPLLARYYQIDTEHYSRKGYRHTHLDNQLSVNGAR